MSFSQLEQNIKKKIAVEENIIRGASALKKKTSNVMVIQKCNTNIREARQNLEYLEDSLKKLRLKTAQQSQGENGSEDNERCNSKEYGFLSTKSPNEHIFSRLDLVKYDCPSLAQRIQYMLQQLEFKLQVEKQYQEANTKLTKLYQIDGDQRSSSAAEGGAMESKYRIQMLNKALKKYQAINVDFDQFKHQPNDIMDNQQPKFRRKQLTGVLTIGITAARDVDHIQSPMFARKPESYVTIKIDDTIKARTKPSRNDRWSEDFQIPVEKGNEIEITVYDKVNDSLIPVAIMWLLLSDIAEEIRKKKAGQTNEQQGWVNASNINGGSSLASEEGSTLTSTYSNSAIQSTSAKNVQGENTSTSQISTNSWFVLEPSGQILLTLGFHKSSQIERKQLMGGLHRHGAIINRKEEIFEQHGHHFVQKSFYNIMCCAYCGDFLRYTGFQCQDCKFLCHKKMLHQCCY
ncbi:AIE_G0001000.mRNA.1.CDS.1 [Saccharomyces cerevisiae]|nr:AIE_G0001000.mRNA.1.CDS.1 [Saccharomyces cerevisiae]CAI6474765.1 AIE_G0001000.mRNA.1.CDS.1 [Saccharomyces cerevisiae]